VRSGGRSGIGDLGRVVRVVVVDQNARGLADALEAPPHAPVARERRRDGVGIQPEAQAGHDGAEAVGDVVADG
jgi:hypothetical protein